MRAQGALCFVVMLVGISGIAAARHLLTEAGSDPSPFMTLDSIMCTSTSPTEVVCEGVVTTAAMVPRVTLVLRLGRNLRFLDVLPHDNRVAFRGSVDSPTAVGSAYATAHNQQGDLVESNVLAIVPTPSPPPPPPANMVLNHAYCDVVDADHIKCEASLTLVESVPRMTLVYNLNGEKYFADCTSSSLEVTCTNTLRSAVATGTCQASGDTATQRFFQSRIVDIAPFPAQPPAA
ncbi:hypothetical protein ACKKBG_A06840 [Auxenochlorella protothecoides x Auxenochlorella symbiontica]|uniref:Uncharacterized protein n=1 Tax=Auxenochlorella protothecoides TaxID=3075 RepID=A0A1D2A3J5_AUXPR|nr:hypothetical protein APUTEX25_002422 [Auxenochlorella protothecoides]|eukprot:RMZ56232.1 hypothetical protein APUTEX25_002422 [Auxenochlorella protothecoides]